MGMRPANNCGCSPGSVRGGGVGSVWTLYRGIRPGEDQGLVAVVETHDIRRRSLWAAYFDDLPFVITLPDGVPVHVQAVSDVRHHDSIIR